MWEKVRRIWEEKSLLENSVISFVLAWITTYILYGKPGKSPTLEFTMQQSFGKTIIYMLILFGVYFALGWFVKKIQHILMPLVVFGAGFLSVFYVNYPWISAGFCMAGVLSLVYVRDDVLNSIAKIKITEKTVRNIYIVLGVFLFCYIAASTALRYYTFTSPDADLGIFTQMYEYMKTTGYQYTTVERNMLLSHFEVHISPVFYLLLPIYALFSHPITLQIAQAALVALTIWPLYLLCRKYKLSNKAILAIGICFTFYPAFSGSCFNDFHENAFLPFFLLFLIYAIEAKKNVLFIVFALLSLSVKEDAAAILIILALYFILSGTDKIRGSILLGISSVYFLGAMAILTKHGQGVLGYMGNMYLNENGGALQVIKTMIMNPGYTLRQCFDVPEKIEYLIWMLLPLSIGLVVTKKYSRYLLVVPCLLFNLIPDHSPVYNIYAQYNFTVTILLFYLFIMNIAEWNYEKQKKFLTVACAITIMLFSVSVLQKSIYQANTFVKERDKFTLMEEVLQEIPEDASVCATARLSAHLAMREELYGVYEGLGDYAVVNLQEDFYTDIEEVRGILTGMGYREIRYEEGIIALFQR